MRSPARHSHPRPRLDTRPVAMLARPYPLRFGASHRGETACHPSLTPRTLTQGVSSDVDPGPLERVRDRLAQDLAGHGRGVALAEEQVAQQVRDGVALRPAEVGVGDGAGE